MVSARPLSMGIWNALTLAARLKNDGPSRIGLCDSKFNTVESTGESQSLVRKKGGREAVGVAGSKALESLAAHFNATQSLSP